MATNQESATTLFALHGTPPHIIHQHNGITYRVGLDGSTVFDAGNGFTIPAPGCPCPEKLLQATGYYFLWINRKWLPFALAIVGLVVLVEVGVLALGEGEAVAAFIARFSFWMNSVLLVLAATAVIGIGIRNTKKCIHFKWGKDDPLLLAPGEISITPDVAVFSESVDETPAEYMARVNAAMAGLKTGQWLLVMRFRSSFLVVQTSDNTSPTVSFLTALRSAPLHGGGQPISHDEALKARTVFNIETWSEYIDYCQRFAEDFAPWAAVEKINHSKNNPIATMLQAASICFALIFFALPMSAQKSKQVGDYLGAVRFEREAPQRGADVSFVFSKSVLSRTGDGAKSYKDLLKSGSYYTEVSDQGALIGVTVGGAVIAPVGGAVKADPITRREATATSAQPLPESVAGGSMFDMLPDSNALQSMKMAHLKEKAHEWVKVAPVLDYYLWRFWGIMGFCLVVGVLLWVLSAVSATDSVKSLHGYAYIGNAITGMHILTKTVLFFLLAFPTVVLLLADAVRVYYTDTFSIFLVVKYAIIALIWYFAFEKILPDSPQMGGGGGGFKGNYPGGRPGLNSGQ